MAHLSLLSPLQHLLEGLALYTCVLSYIQHARYATDVESLQALLPDHHLLLCLLDRLQGRQASFCFTRLMAKPHDFDSSQKIVFSGKSARIHF